MRIPGQHHRQPAHAEDDQPDRRGDEDRREDRAEDLHLPLVEGDSADDAEQEVEVHRLDRHRAARGRGGGGAAVDVQGERGGADRAARPHPASFGVTPFKQT